MAEQTQAANPAAAKEKAPPVPKVKVEKISTFKALRELRPDEKCPPQAKVVLGLIAAAGAGGITRANLLAKLKEPNSGLTTTQTPEKIVGFYQPKLVASELISVTKSDVAAAPAAEKPAADAKSAGKTGNKEVKQ